MKRAYPQSGRWKQALIGGAATGLVGALLALSPLGDGLANLSYDLLLRLRPTIQPNGVALVFMDDRAAETLGQQDSPTWDRTLHARLIDRLVALGARAIVFDILFQKREANDHLLLKAVARAANAGVPVIVGATFVPKKVDERFDEWVTPLALPFDELLTNVAWGMVVGPTGQERVIRRHRLDWPNRPSLASAVARLVLPQAPPPANTERWINYYGPPSTFHYGAPSTLPKFRFSDVLQETNSQFTLHLSNQVVFVGEMSAPAPNPGGSVRDNWLTPFTGWWHDVSSGLEINATAYLNVARQDWLMRLPAGVEAFLLLCVGSALGIALIRSRLKAAAAVSCTAAIVTAAAALWAVWQARVWFPWLIVAGVQIPLALGWAVLVHARTIFRDKEFLEKRIAVLEPALDIAGLSQNAARSTAVSRPLTPSFPLSQGEEWKPTISVSGSAGAGKNDGQDGPAIPDHTLLRCVGKGSYGEVWLARNAIGLWHAVKVVNRGNFSSQEPFEREFRGIQRFMPVSRLHPGLVQILHVGRDEAAGCIYYVMEPGDDETTGEKIQPETYRPKTVATEIRRRGRLSGAECVELGLALAAALEFLHSQQLIHRDIKPANIIYVRGQPKFTDIGLVTGFATTEIAASYLGTQGYIPPEGPGRPTADIFSLGRVLYEAWTGLPCERYPELPADMRERPDRDLLLALNKIVIKACHPDLAQRYASAAQMQQDLRRLSGAAPANSVQL